MQNPTNTKGFIQLITGIKRFDFGLKKGKRNFLTSYCEFSNNNYKQPASASFSTSERATIGETF